MAQAKPLVFDTARGVSRQLEHSDALLIPGDLQLDGLLGFYGKAPQAQATISGSWGQSVDQLIKALSALGLIHDSRPLNWMNGVTSVSNIGAVGSYEPGRLLIGSVGGWMQLDQPAQVAGTIQVPVSHAGAEEVNPISGLPMRQLAYSPVLSYGPTAPPTTPMVGAIWFDTQTQQLRVYTGSSWQTVESPALVDLVRVLQPARPGALLVADGNGSLKTITAPLGGQGMVLAFDQNQAGQFINLVTVDRLPPWRNGNSAFAALPGGGGRPPGLPQAIWCNNSTNGETIGFWDETALAWKNVYVNNPVLNRLAELRGSLVDGDLLLYKGNTVDRLGIGRTGESLTVDGHEVKWHQRFVVSASAPSGSLDGDFWLDSSTDVVRVREQGRWLDFNEVERYVDANGSGGQVKAGQVLRHAAPNWQLADNSTPSGALLAIALEDAAAGARLSGAVGGIVSLSEAQWDAVIDGADVRAVGTGLSPGRDYFVSSRDPGKLTSKPDGGAGVPIGTALSGTHLLLRLGDLRNARQIARVHVGVAPPNAAVGELWWSDAAGQLSVYEDQGGTGRWVPVNTAAAGGTTPGGTAGGATPGAAAGPATPPVVSLADLVVTDWVGDPLAAAIRMRYSDGSTASLRIRGAGGAVVSMSDNHTLVIDAGGSLHGTGPLPAGGGEGQVLVWRGGVAKWETISAGTGGGGSGGSGVGGGLVAGNGITADATSQQVTGIDEGTF